MSHRTQSGKPLKKFANLEGLILSVPRETSLASPQPLKMDHQISEAVEAVEGTYTNGLLGDERSSGEPVILNVYDMFWTNEYTGNMGLGVYHSGLQVIKKIIAVIL